MSKMEYNKGCLIPVTWEEILAEFPDADMIDLPYDTDGKYECFMGKLYRAEFEVQGGDLDQIARATEREDGTIEFETYHYNGGAHWTEVVEQGLRK